MAKMPNGMVDIFDKLCQDVYLVHWQWAAYRVLYGTSPERIDLLNRVAPDFFWLVERTLSDAVLMSLVRMADPACTGRHENLSLPRLIEAVPKNHCAGFQKELQDLMETVELRCRTFREIRNRRIAHRDLPTALNYHTDPLPGVSRQAVEDALDSIRQLMNHIAEYYENRTIWFQGAGEPNPASKLVFFLEQAMGEAMSGPDPISLK